LIVQITFEPREPLSDGDHQGYPKILRQNLMERFMDPKNSKDAVFNRVFRTKCNTL